MCTSILYMLHCANPNAHFKRHLDQFMPFFAQFSAESLYTLQLAVHFPTRNCPFALGGIWTPSHACFLGPTRIHIPNGISFGSAIFTGLRNCDRLTDRSCCSVCNNRLHLCSTVLQPHNGTELCALSCWLPPLYNSDKTLEL